MSSLIKRNSSKNWYYSSGDTRYNYPRSTGTANKKLARKIQAKWDEERILKGAGVLNHSNITFIQAVREYTQQQRLVCKDSTLNTISTCTKPILDYFKGYYISQIEAKEVNAYKLYRLDQDVSTKAVKNEIKWVLNGIFKLAILNKYVHSNPTKEIKVKQVKKNPTKVIPHEKIMEIIQIADSQRDKIYIKVLYYTGLSSMDAGTLQKDQVKDGHIETQRRKTNNPVYIPIHKDLKDEDITDLMPTKREYHCFYQRFKTLLNKVGLADKGYNVMSLRHSINSRLAEMGLHFEDRKKILGHATNVNRDYTHYNIEYAEKLINKL